VVFLSSNKPSVDDIAGHENGDQGRNLRQVSSLCCGNLSLRLTIFSGCKGAGVYLRACSRTYLACNAHAPYCVRHLWLNHILIKGTIFGKKLLNIKYVFDFLYNFYPKHFSF
jgi:hypothetical protein